MADNVTANAGSGGATFKTDDDGTAHWPYAKLAWGADNTQTPVDSGAAAVPIQDGGNSITVDGTLAVTNAGLTALNGAIAGTEVQVDIVGALPAGTNAIGKLAANSGVDIGDVDVTSCALPTGAATSAKQDSQITLLAGGLPAALAANGGLKVEGVAGGVAVPVSLATVPSHAVTNAGTFVVQENGAALTALQLIDDSIKADDAAFTVGTDKVTVAGGVVVAHGSSPDAADAGDAAAPLMNRHRVLFTQGGHPNVKSATYIWTGSTTDDNILPAISSGTKYAITRISYGTDEATTVGVSIRIGFGTANVPSLGAANADAVDDILVYHPGLVPGTKYTDGDGSGLLGVGGDGAELRITAEATTNGTGFVTVTYYTIES